MKPYSSNPGEAHGTKYARKSKRIATRVKVERTHKKRARRELIGEPGMHPGDWRTDPIGMF